MVTKVITMKITTKKQSICFKILKSVVLINSINLLIIYYKIFIKIFSDFYKILTSCINFTSIIAVAGTLSDGFSMNVFPQAIARGNIHSGIIAGKLNGQIPATTPSGCR